MDVKGEKQYPMQKELGAIGLFTRQPFSLLGKVAFWTSLVATLCGAGGVIALTLINGSPSRDIVITALLALLMTALIATRIRWMQGISALINIGYLYMTFTKPFVIESLVAPKGPTGGYGHFIGDVIIIATALIAFVANIGMVLQNYHRISYVKLHWFRSAFSIIGGMVVGALFIGAVAPSAPPVAVAMLQAPQIPTGKGVPTSVNMGMANAPTSVLQLHQATTTTRVDHFTLTAQTAQLTLSPVVIVSAWTFNGTAPRPVLHVRQGDEVEVTLINHLTFGVTTHWHGVRVPMRLMV